jgi:hypothetical protein
MRLLALLSVPSALLSLPASTGAAVPEDVVARTIRFEGKVPHLYLDTEGNVTVGVGHLLPSADAAGRLALVRKSDGKPASAEEKKQDWNAVHAAEKGHPAAFYAKFAKLELPATAIEDLLKADLAAVEQALKAQFPDLLAPAGSGGAG